MLEELKKLLSSEKLRAENKTQEVTSIGNWATNDDAMANEEIINTQSYQQGFAWAGQARGSLHALEPALHAIRLRVQQKMINDDSVQEGNRIKIQNEITQLEGNKNECIQTKNTLSEKLNFEENKIEKIKEEISRLKNHPEDVTGSSPSKASFIIGLIILSFLTIYLFVFYSSASYSTFFKHFSLNDIGVANAIFDAKALSQSFKDGFTELVLICTIPFVFLGLGYLIHKFQESKGFGKYLKIVLLFIVTFVFDAILAYEITEKIYNIIRENSFDNLPPYSFPLAFQEVNFWLIIFSGFIVYVIWGFVFSFVMESYSKLDKVKVQIDEKEKKLIQYKSECKNIKVKIEELDAKINNFTTSIRQKNIDLERRVYPPLNIQLEMNYFLTGWINYMSNLGMNKDEQEKARSIGDNIILAVQNEEKNEKNI